MLDSALHFVQDRLNRREGKKWAKRVNDYFLRGFIVTEFAREEVALDPSSHALCGYFCGFMDVLFQTIGHPQRSQRGAYGAQTLIADLMPKKQASWLEKVLLIEGYSEQPTAHFGVGRLRGAADANAYLAGEQKYAFADFLFKEFRNLCRCTNPQVINKLSRAINH